MSHFIVFVLGNCCGLMIHSLFCFVGEDDE